MGRDHKQTGLVRIFRVVNQYVARLLGGIYKARYPSTETPKESQAIDSRAAEVLHSSLGAQLLSKALETTNSRAAELLDKVRDGNLRIEERRAAAETLSELGYTDEAAGAWFALASNQWLDYRTRCGAAKALFELGHTDEAIAACLAISRDTRGKRWREEKSLLAIQTLGELGPHAAVIETLRNLTDDRKARDGVRYEAAKVLSKFNRDEAKALFELGHTDKAIAICTTMARDKRWPEEENLFAIQTLDEFGPHAAVIEALLNLTDDGEVRDAVRYEAAKVLNKFGCTDVTVKAWLGLARDGRVDSDVRRVAAQALGELGRTNDAIVTFLTLAPDGEMDSDMRRAVKVLRELSHTDETVAVLLALARNRKLDSYVRLLATKALSELNCTDEAIAAWLALARDEELANYVRPAVEAMGEVGYTEEVMTILLTLARDGEVSGGVRGVAIRALGTLGAREAIPDLMRWLQDGDEDAYVRRAAPEALTMLGMREAIPALMERLGDEDYYARQAIAKALVTLEAREVIPKLIEQLQNENEHVRWTAAITLGMLGAREAIPALMKRLRDKGHDVHEAAAEALGVLGAREAVPALIEQLRDEHWKEREAVLKALGMLRAREAIPALMEQLRDEDEYVCRAAAQALKTLEAREAIPVLMEKLQSKNWYMRKTAAETLGMLGAREVIPALIEGLRDEEESVRWAAAEALEKLGAQEVITDREDQRRWHWELSQKHIGSMPMCSLPSKWEIRAIERNHQAFNEALSELARKAETTGLARQHPEPRPTLLRYSDISFPTHTRVGQAEALRVVITLKPVTDQAAELVLEPSEPNEVEALVVVSPLDFDQKSPNFQTIQVPPDADSAPVIFELVPKSEGRKVIAVDFFQNGCYLGRGEVETTVGQQIVESYPVSVQHALSLSAMQLPPDLTILFDRVSVGDGKHYYRYRLLSFIRELKLGFEEYRTPETHVMPQGFLEETFTHLNRLHSDSSSESVFFERLNSIGTDLYNRLFPDDLKSLYWDKLRERVKSILIISYEPWIPWELIRPFHPQTKQIEDGFLCEKFDLTRWLAGTAAPDIIQLTRLGLIMAASGLKSVELEATEIKQLFGDEAESISPSGEAVYQLLKTGGFAGLHFACHGEYNSETPDWSTLFLEGATLCPIDINGDKLVFSKDHPFVFLNACETGQGGYALTGMGGWAEAFVGRAKSSGFVGSTWEADDESAYKFALAFYRNLLDGMTVARAAKLARLSIKRTGDPTWLSYTVYANPLARLATGTVTHPQ